VRDCLSLFLSSSFLSLLAATQGETAECAKDNSRRSIGGFHSGLYLEDDISRSKTTLNDELHVKLVYFDRFAVQSIDLLAASKPSRVSSREYGVSTRG
jgi:hypothetical protein